MTKSEILRILDELFEAKRLEFRHEPTMPVYWNEGFLCGLEMAMKVIRMRREVD